MSLGHSPCPVICRDLLINTGEIHTMYIWKLQHAQQSAFPKKYPRRNTKTDFQKSKIIYRCFLKHRRFLRCTLNVFFQQTETTYLLSKWNNTTIVYAEESIRMNSRFS